MTEKKKWEEEILKEFGGLWLEKVENGGYIHPKVETACWRCGCEIVDYINKNKKYAGRICLGCAKI